MADMLSTQRTIVLAKLETTYGAYIEPSANEFVRAIDVQLRPVEGNTITHDESCGMGSKYQYQVGQHVSLSFKVAVTGAEVAGAKPREGMLIEACQFGVTLGTSPKNAVYKPVNVDNPKSLSMITFIDGNMHYLTGARGAMTIEVNNDDFVYLKFEFKGIYKDPATGTFPEIDCAGLNQNPVPFGYGVSYCKFDNSFEAGLYSLSLSNGTNPKYISTTDQREVVVNERTISGSIEIGAPKISTRNFFALAKSGGTTYLDVMHNRYGRSFRAQCSKAQVLTPTYGDQQGRRSLQMSLSAMPNAGHELTLTYS